jgi:hypothetical protein
MKFPTLVAAIFTFLPLNMTVWEKEAKESRPLLQIQTAADTLRVQV